MAGKHNSETTILTISIMYGCLIAVVRAATKHETRVTNDKAEESHTCTYVLLHVGFGPMLIHCNVLRIVSHAWHTCYILWRLCAPRKQLPTSAALHSPEAVLLPGLQRDPGPTAHHMQEIILPMDLWVGLFGCGPPIVGVTLFVNGNSIVRFLF